MAEERLVAKQRAGVVVAEATVGSAGLEGNLLKVTEHSLVDEAAEVTTMPVLVPSRLGLLQMVRIKVVL